MQNIGAYPTVAAVVGERVGAGPRIEYWIDEADGSGAWQSARPGQEQIRLNFIVHEASPLWSGKAPGSSVVGLDSRPRGVYKVYAVGGALFPTSGARNPTLTLCGLAPDLAGRLTC